MYLDWKTVKKVEAHNVELEGTIRTLKRKVDILEMHTGKTKTHDITESILSNQATNATGKAELCDSNSLIIGVQNQLTNI